MLVTQALMAVLVFDVAVRSIRLDAVHIVDTTNTSSCVGVTSRGRDVALGSVGFGTVTTEPSRTTCRIPSGTICIACANTTLLDDWVANRCWRPVAVVVRNAFDTNVGAVVAPRCVGSQTRRRVAERALHARAVGKTGGRVGGTLVVIRTQFTCTGEPTDRKRDRT